VTRTPRVSHTRTSPWVMGGLTKREARGAGGLQTAKGELVGVREALRKPDEYDIWT
jgi:hypothetical protein